MRKKVARSLALGLMGLMIQRGPAMAMGPPDDGPPTATPIKHLVVIFQENVSFDHYFATYPKAANLSGEPVFQAASGTPSAVNSPTFRKNATSHGSGSIATSPTGCSAA